MKKRSLVVCTILATVLAGTVSTVYAAETTNTIQQDYETDTDREEILPEYAAESVVSGDDSMDGGSTDEELTDKDLTDEDIENPGAGDSDTGDSGSGDSDTGDSGSGDSGSGDSGTGDSDTEDPVSQAGWIITEDGKRWQKEDGSIATDTWITFEENNYYLGSDGAVHIGWLKLDNLWYYTDSDGCQVADCWIGQYYINAQGIWDTSVKWHAPGWKKNSTGWWWQNKDGSYPASAWELINDHWYYFNASGYMTTGWQLINNRWYYMASSGEMKTGWQLINNKWYLMNSSGHMLTGWQKLGNTWYYLNASGAMKTGWLKSGNTWYYLKSSGAMATGWNKIDSTWYYMNSLGSMQTGWIKLNNIWYYLNGSGAMQTGWIKPAGTWYYLNNSGAMQTGWLVSGSSTYYLGANGAMSHSSWKEIDGKWYYFAGNGKMAKNTWIDSYYVDSTGAWDPSVKAPTYVWPCPGYVRLSSDYGYRKPPTAGASTLHNGIDLAAPAGTQILAFCDGKVLAYGYNNSMGNYVKIQHTGGLVSVYMHMNKIANISTGQQLKAGTVIGYVGSTGVATGSHLHFSVLVNGSYVSPWNYLTRP